MQSAGNRLFGRDILRSYLQSREYLDFNSFIHTAEFFFYHLAQRIQDSYYLRAGTAGFFSDSVRNAGLIVIFFYCLYSKPS